MNKELQQSRGEGIADYSELKGQYPELFKPIPERIGVTTENPDGFPNGAVDGWRDMDSPNFVEVRDNGEPLVNLANLRQPIFTTNDYGSKLTNSAYEVPLEGSTMAQYVREDVAEQLLEAQRQLPPNYRLVVFDAWRSLDTQYSTYEMCYQSLVEKLTEEGVVATDEELTPATKELISKETQKFISLPSPLPDSFHQSEADRERARKIPSPHNTGGSVDLCLVKVDDEVLEELQLLEAEAGSIDDPFSVEKAKANFKIARIYREHATLPDFGTAFDFAGARSGLTYAETSDELSDEARDSRRMLYNAMTSAGFEPYAEEWWHFNSGNQMAEATKLRRTGEKGVAKYGNAELSDEQKLHEQVHKDAFELLQNAANDPSEKENLTSDLRELVDTIGSPSETSRFIPTHDMKYRGEIPTELIDAIHAAQRS